MSDEAAAPMHVHFSCNPILGDKDSGWSSLTHAAGSVAAELCHTIGCSLQDVAPHWGSGMTWRYAGVVLRDNRGASLCCML